MVWLLRHKTPRLGAVKPDAFLVRGSMQEWPLISRPSIRSRSVEIMRGPLERYH